MTLSGVPPLQCVFLVLEVWELIWGVEIGGVRNNSFMCHSHGLKSEGM